MHCKVVAEILVRVVVFVVVVVLVVIVEVVVVIPVVVVIVVVVTEVVVVVYSSSNFEGIYHVDGYIYTVYKTTNITNLISRILKFFIVYSYSNYRALKYRTYDYYYYKTTYTTIVQDIAHR